MRANIWADCFGIEGSALLGGIVGDALGFAFRRLTRSSSAAASTAVANASETSNLASVPNNLSIADMQLQSCLNGIGYGFLVKFAIDLVAYLWQSMVTYKTDPIAIAALSNPLELAKLIENAILSVVGGVIGVAGASCGVHYMLTILAGIVVSLILQLYLTEPIKKHVGTVTVVDIIWSAMRGLRQAVGLAPKEVPIRYVWNWGSGSEPDDIYKDFICPISLTYPAHPCFLYGHVYDRHVIETWLAVTSKCPLTNQPATMSNVVVNMEYSRLVIEYGSLLGGQRVVVPCTRFGAALNEPCCVAVD
jgi:hypothetical protein